MRQKGKFGEDMRQNFAHKTAKRWRNTRGNAHYCLLKSLCILKMHFGRSYCVRNGKRARGKPWHLRSCLLGDFHMLHTPNTQKAWSLAPSTVRTSPKRLAPY